MRLEYERSDGARPSRAAYVFLEDGRFVNEWIVREGFAKVTGSRELRRRNALERAEAEARAARRGIWAAGDRDFGRIGRSS